MNELADSHVHLDDRAFDDDRDEVVARAMAAQVRTLVIPGVDIHSWPRIKTLCTPGSGLFAAYGLHPLFLDRHREAHVAELPSWLEDHPAVAVGEIGLDFHDPALDPERQRFFFRRQLDVAREHRLPVIVHARNALEEVIQTLRRLPGLRGVVHSFSGSEQQARQLWDMGFCVGIGGPVTYERAQRLRRIVSGMPVEFLLLESDAPDQPDADHRGQRNEPARLAGILRCVAQLRGETEAAVAAATTANVRRLFGLAPPAG
ncbi:DNAase [Frateuria sp. Soil773]|uniref:TatD family hydrolase n=1 Tax=Frateuria sp. Soil773 TaxID=1736407 RepID=UPI0007017F2F|nr:TatD family hydrolase [Frateuria sp. Soil773]KRE92437.1 DNAase [Frateuria sp. Soil773]